MMKIALLVGVLSGSGETRTEDAGSAASSDVPGPLVLLQSAAEDLGHEAAESDWSRAAVVVEKASRDLSAVAPRADNAVVERARGHLEAVKKAIQARRPLDAQFAANALSADVVEILSAYHPIVPVDAMRLDVLLRRVQLEAQANAPDRATAPLDQARAIWTRLRAESPLHETPTERSFEHQLKQVEKAAARRDAESLADAAADALQGVDALEGVFENARRSK